MPDQPSTSLSTTLNPPSSTPWIAYAFLFLLCFGFGIATQFIWQNWERINELYYTASEQKYRTMTGEAGPATYLVYHSDFEALDRFANNKDDVIGVEIYRYPNVSAIAVDSEDSNSIAQLTALSFVDKIERRVVPMLCH